MNKAQLLTSIQSKAGFVSIVSDNVAPDSPTGVKEKRYLVVETLNADSTKGITNVFYIHDTETDTAWFYNVEPVAFDNQYKNIPQQTLEALQNYCKTNFEAYFLIPDRIDAENKWAVVEAYTISSGKLAKSLKMVYKKGTNPITHIDII